MISSRINRSLLLAAAALLSACATDPGENKLETASVSDTGILLSASQVKNGAIAFGTIGKRQLSLDIRAKGKLSLPANSEATVNSVVGGIIGEILVRPGDHVTRGKWLCTVTSPEIIQIQQDFVSAENRYRLLESDYLRKKELAGEGITSEKIFYEAESAFNEVKISKEAIRIRLEQLNLPVDDLQKGIIRRSAPVVSPIEGDIDQIGARLGGFTEPGNVLFSVVNKNNLYIELMVFEKDVSFVRIGQRVTFELANLGNSEYEARVITIGKRVEEDARTVRVLADFVNKSPYILPGMFVAAEIHTAEADLDALPEEAVESDHDGAYCFYTLSGVNDTAMRFIRLPLKTGFKEDGYIQVEPLRPLPEGARIVTAGTYFIKAEGLKNAE